MDDAEQYSDHGHDHIESEGYLDTQIELILHKVFNETTYENQIESQFHLLSRCIDIISREKKINSYYNYFLKQSQSGINQNMYKNTMNIS